MLAHRHILFFCDIEFMFITLASAQYNLISFKHVQCCLLIAKN